MTYTVLRVGDEDIAGAMPIGPEHGPTASHWSAYFDVEDCDATAVRALQLGGTQVLRDDTRPPARWRF